MTVTITTKVWSLTRPFKATGIAPSGVIARLKATQGINANEEVMLKEAFEKSKLVWWSMAINKAQGGTKMTTRLRFISEQEATDFKNAIKGSLTVK